MQVLNSWWYYMQKKTNNCESKKKYVRGKRAKTEIIKTEAVMH